MSPMDQSNHLKLIRMQESLTIVITGEISHCTANEDAAIALLNPADNDKLAISQRMTKLKSNPIPRVPEVIGPIFHGQSLSLFHEASKGSFGVYLTPLDKGLDEAVYALTAAHVLPTDLSQATAERRIITPGGLDILTKLGEICNSKKSREDDLDFFLRRWHESCGEVFASHIETNSEDWRSDWALCHLAQEWQEGNGTWFLPGEVAQLSHSRGGVPVYYILMS
ncbi:hypothetical protein V8E54_008461 [Elaphomyces granulatus]